MIELEKVPFEEYCSPLSSTIINYSEAYLWKYIDDVIEMRFNSFTDSKGYNMADKNYDLIVVGSGMGGFLAAARIAEKGVNPQNGEPLHVALVERGPYLSGTPRPGYGVPKRRQLFTNITSEFHENGRYQMQYYPDGPGRPQYLSSLGGKRGGGRQPALASHDTGSSGNGLPGLVRDPRL